MRFPETHMRADFYKAHTFLQKVMGEIEYISYEVAGIEPSIKHIHAPQKLGNANRQETVSLEFEGNYENGDAGEILRRTNQKFSRNDEGSTLKLKDVAKNLFLVEISSDSSNYQKKKSGRKKHD